MTDVLLDRSNGPLFATLERIVQTEGTWCLIGGLAVWCRLAVPHRATLDVDTAAYGVAHETLAGLRDSAAEPIGSKLDVIEVEDPSGHLDEEPLFLAAHWAAATTATPCTIGYGSATVTIPVARPGILVACKLRAWLARPRARLDKRGGDGLDIVRLLRRADWDEIADDVAQYPPLQGPAGAAAREVLVDRSHEVSRWIRDHTDEAPPDESEVEALGSLMVDACASR